MSRRRKEFIIFLSASIIAGSANILPDYLKDHAKPPKAVSYTQPFEHLRTISLNNDLLGYVVYQTYNALEDTICFNIVVRDLNPATDDYKAICRAVVADIKQWSRLKEMKVNIYDSSEACSLYEVKWLQEHEFLNSEQLALVHQHTIASYIGNISNEPNANTIAYFTDAANGLAELETFTL